MHRVLDYLGRQDKGVFAWVSKKTEKRGYGFGFLQWKVKWKGRNRSKFWERRGDLGGCFLGEMEGVLKNFVKICVKLWAGSVIWWFGFCLANSLSLFLSWVLGIWVSLLSIVHSRLFVFPQIRISLFLFLFGLFSSKILRKNLPKIKLIISYYSKILRKIFNQRKKKISFYGEHFVFSVHYSWWCKFEMLHKFGLHFYLLLFFFRCKFWFEKNLSSHHHNLLVY